MTLALRVAAPPDDAARLDIVIRGLGDATTMTTAPVPHRQPPTGARAQRLARALPMVALLVDADGGAGAFAALCDDHAAFADDDDDLTAEALALGDWLAARALPIRYLDEILAYECAVLDVLDGGPGQVVRFTHDPLPLLRALARRAIPIAARVGRFEVEIAA